MVKAPWLVWFVALLLIGLVIGFVNLFVLVILALLAPTIVKSMLGAFAKPQEPPDAKKPE